MSLASSVKTALAFKLESKNLSVNYVSFPALKSVSMGITERAITAIIGPSGCGKSTFIRCLNRMNDKIPGFHLTGEILLENTNIYSLDKRDLRKRMGMVFQRPNPFPLSIYENVAYGPRIHDMARGKKLHELVEKSLAATDLFEQVKDILHRPALSLPLESQQRLCISRLLAVEPEVLLMDEPCSALDPISTLKIEQLFQNLKKNYTIVLVTHNMQQAGRISDFTAFFLLGDLIEYGVTSEIFTNPKDQRTENYLTGRFG